MKKGWSNDNKKMIPMTIIVFIILLLVISFIIAAIIVAPIWGKMLAIAVLLFMIYEKLEITLHEDSYKHEIRE